MPELPSWLKSADPAAHFMEAYRAGGAIAQANARLAAEQQQSAQRFAMETQRMQQEQQQQDLRLKYLQEQQQQRQMVEQQKLQVAQQYHEQQIEMQKQKLQEAKRYNDQRTQVAAQKFAMSQQYGKAVEAIDQAVEDGQLTQAEGDAEKRKAIIRFMPPTGAGASSALQALRPPAKFGKTEGGQEYVIEPSGEARYGATIPPNQRRANDLTPSQAATIREKDPAGMSDATKKGLDAIIASGIPKGMMPQPGQGTGTNAAPAATPGLWDRIKNVFAPGSLGDLAQKKAQTTATATTPAPSDDNEIHHEEQGFDPAPKDPKEREAGVTYQTPKGPHTWTGKGWKTYEPSAAAKDEAPAEPEPEPEPDDEEE